MIMIDLVTIGVMFVKNDARKRNESDLRLWFLLIGSSSKE